MSVENGGELPKTTQEDSVGAVGKESADLFVTKDFVMHSGEPSTWKIEADALTISDLKTLAKLASEVLVPFSKVVGIPTGGTRFAEYLKPYLSDAGPTLIVDDVLTTGKSMKAARKEHGKDSIGLVIFARSAPPAWVEAIFTYTLGE